MEAYGTAAGLQKIPLYEQVANLLESQILNQLEDGDLLPSEQQLAEQFDMLQRSFAAAEKIFTVMDMVPEIVDSPGAKDLENIRGEIEFRDVWFAYNPGEWVLKGVSFHISPKQTVAFVGSTGSGKSTILSLICRNYDIQKGQILMDGVDIKEVTIASLRRHFGQMLQDVFLFSGTIRSNIVQD